MFRLWENENKIVIPFRKTVIIPHYRSFLKLILFLDEYNKYHVNFRPRFEHYYLAFDRVLRNNKKSRWALLNKIRLAKDTFYPYSSFPIKFISSLGVLSSLFLFIVIKFYFNIKFFGNENFWGYTPPG